MLSKNMRWIWALAVACLVAAAPVRPAPTRDGNRATTLEVAPQALPIAGQRRELGGSPELRLPAATLATSLSIAPPRVFALVTTPAPPHVPYLESFSPRSSRGPPVDA